MGIDFLNPDDLAKTAPQNMNALIWSGREIHRLIENHIKGKISFAVETTLSGNNHFKTLAQVKAAGFHTALHFVFVGDLEISMARVRTRVKLGGHDVDERDQLRR